MSRKLKAFGLAMVASLACIAFATSAAVSFPPAPASTPSIGEMALALGLIATSLLATFALGTPRDGLTGTTNRSQLSDSDELTVTTTRRHVLSHTDQGEAQPSIRHPLRSPAGAH